MIVAEISCLETGSTGKIMMNIAKVAREKGINVETFSGYRKKTREIVCPEHHHRISGLIDYYIHSEIGRYTGKSNFITHKTTEKLISLILQIKPDIIHLHITHGCYINNEILFDFLASSKTPIVWTMHDCWAFTGRCPHFVLSNCSKWQTGCYDCPYPSTDYPASKVDKTCLMWEKKRESFTKPEKMYIVTPSMWLSGIIKDSFLSKYPTRVINNGIDQNVFKPRKTKFKESYSIPDKNFIILGVASDWNNRKGLDVFLQLSEILKKSYTIVLVGTNDDVDKSLPDRIISIHRTEDQRHLSEIYSVADVFVNPTKEDNFPTVNIEALSCGTPVITYSTGGSPEIIDNHSGCVILDNDINTLVDKIEWICRDRPFCVEDCLSRASLFEMNRCLNQYVVLYNEIYNSKS